jgi:hypothetical protein
MINNGAQEDVKRQRLQRLVYCRYVPLVIYRNDLFQFFVGLLKVFSTTTMSIPNQNEKATNPHSIDSLLVIKAGVANTIPS